MNFERNSDDNELPDVTGLVPRHERLYYIRYYRFDDPDHGIVKILKPSGGILAVFSENMEIWANDELRERVFPRLHKIDEVEVTKRQFRWMMPLCAKCLQRTFTMAADEAFRQVMRDSGYA